MTPHEATMSPLEHESAAAHTTCPPDDARMYAAHDPDSARHDSADEHADDHVVSRHPAPPPAEAHTKPAAADMDALTRDIPTPMTTTDDGTDDHRASQPSPLSTTAPASLPLAASQLTWPFPAQRVRRSAPHARMQHPANGPYSSSQTRPLPCCAPAAVSEAARHQTASSTRSRSSCSMSTCASRSCADTCASKVRTRGVVLPALAR
jgi:hypothetical protein